MMNESVMFRFLLGSLIIHAVMLVLLGKITFTDTVLQLPNEKAAHDYAIAYLIQKPAIPAKNEKSSPGLPRPAKNAGLVMTTL